MKILVALLCITLFLSIILITPYVKANSSQSAEIKLLQKFDAESYFGAGEVFGGVKPTKFLGDGKQYFFVWSSVGEERTPFPMAPKLRLIDEDGNVKSGWVKDGQGDSNTYDGVDVGDVDGDGEPEVVWGTSTWWDQPFDGNGKLYCFGKDGAQKATLPIPTDALGVGNTYGGEIRVIVAVQGTREVRCYKVSSGQFLLQWTFSDFREGSSPNVFTYDLGTHELTLYDMDRDGKKEILLSGPSGDSDYYIMKDNGSSASILFTVRGDQHADFGDVRDINGDGSPELVVVPGSMVYYCTRSNGEWTEKWSTHLSHAQYAYLCKPDGATPKVAVMDKYARKIYILSIENGSIERSVSVDNVDEFDVFDIDGDGKDEAIAVDQNTFKVYDEFLNVKYSLSNIPEPSHRKYREEYDFDFDGALDYDGDGNKDAVASEEWWRYIYIIGVSSSWRDGIPEVNFGIIITLLTVTIGGLYVIHKASRKKKGARKRKQRH